MSYLDHTYIYLITKSWHWLLHNWRKFYLMSWWLARRSTWCIDVYKATSWHNALYYEFYVRSRGKKIKEKKIKGKKVYYAYSFKIIQNLCLILNCFKKCLTRMKHTAAVMKRNSHNSVKSDTHQMMIIIDDVLKIFLCILI
jgi:hypothetical protein